VDLYAGSGAVGIEAISRGAAHVFFSESAAKAAAVIRANLKALDIRVGTSIEPGGTPTLLKRLVKQGTVLDLVFLDPPYEAADEYTRTLNALGGEAFIPCLSPNVLVIAEHTRKQSLAGSYGRLTRTRTLLQGDAALSFYDLSEPVPELPTLVE
jgi:16S rRNA (guanine(966)-N(2))-methyltransferase RsmD